MAAFALATALAACGGGGEDPSRQEPPQPESPVQPVQPPVPPLSERGALISGKTTGVLSRDAIEEEYDKRYVIRELAGGPPRCDVTMHQIVYETVAPSGAAARASAGVAIPDRCEGPFPLLVYHHGTETKRASTMADPGNGETQVIILFFASQGYAVVMPDYHGYAESTLDHHPYLHAENTAAVSIDAMRAARHFLGERDVALSDRLFLWGYSQGGHAAMATHRALERDHAGQWELTASSPASGPYALSETVLDVLRNPTYGSPAYAPMLLVGLEKAYGDVYGTPDEVFQAPWYQWIEGLLPGDTGGGALVDAGLLPTTLTGPGGLLTEAFVNGYLVDAYLPARQRVAQNDLLGWIPRAPMKLCGGSRDEVVPFYNSTLAQASFRSMGAPVDLLDIEEDSIYGPLVSLLRRLGLDEGGYHGGVVSLLCASYAKRDVFDPLR